MHWEESWWQCGMGVPLFLLARQRNSQCLWPWSEGGAVLHPLCVQSCGSRVIMIDRCMFSARLVLVPCLHRDKPFFFLSVLAPVSLSHHMMPPSLHMWWRVWKPGDHQYPASLMLWFLTYWKLFYLGVIPAAGFLLLFLFLLFALQIREKNSFLVFLFLSGGWGLGRS